MTNVPVALLMRALIDFETYNFGISEQGFLAPLASGPEFLRQSTPHSTSGAHGY